MKIIPASKKDFTTIQQIAYSTWGSTYGDILTKEQIDYMLDMMYSTEALNEQSEKLEHHFLLAVDNNEIEGFVSYEIDYESSSKTKIHKLYVLPQSQGKSIGKKLINEVATKARENQDTAITLNVNRYNKSVGFYKTMDFSIIQEVDIKIGNGFLMEDYVLEKAIL